MHPRHPWLNRVAVFVAVGVLLMSALGYIVYKERPSFHKISASVSSVQRPRFAEPGTKASRGLNFRSLVNGLMGPEPVYPPHLSEASTDAITERFIGRGDTDVRVCEMLGDLREPPPRGAADLHRWTDERLANRMENPFLETMLIPMGAVLSRPAFAQVATRTIEAALGGDISAELDVLQAQAQADLYSASPQLEDISLRAYHLFTIFKSVNWHPELAQDFSTIELCEMIEARLEAAIVGEFSGVPMRTETQELLSWLAANRVTSRESGFDPRLSGAVSVLVTPTSIAIETPWMRTSVGSGLVLGRPPALDPSVQAGR